MILVDTSVWIDHFRSGNNLMAGLLNNGRVLMHPFVLGELALGQLADRQELLLTLGHLPQIGAAEDDEVLAFITRQRLFGTGLGYVDAHLLVALRLRPGALFWTNDKKLGQVAATMGLAMVPG